MPAVVVPTSGKPPAVEHPKTREDGAPADVTRSKSPLKPKAGLSGPPVDFKKNPIFSEPFSAFFSHVKSRTRPKTGWLAGNRPVGTGIEAFVPYELEAGGVKRRHRPMVSSGGERLANEAISV